MKFRIGKFITLIAVFPSIALANSPPPPPGLPSSTSFFSTTPQTSPAHTDYELYKIFTSGVGPYSSSMDGKIYPYRLTQNGQKGSPLYNGCYDDQNKRLSDLDSNNSCASAISANPSKSVFRLFMGYKVDCIDLNVATGICNDMGLSMNCQMTQVQVGTGTFASTAPDRLCSPANPIVRRAKAISNVLSSTAVCFPGTDGTTPNCSPCADGFYNDVIGSNTVACKPCPHTTPANAASSPVNFTTNGTGAISVTQCKIASSDPWTCAPGYKKNTTTNQTCYADITCNLSLSLSPTSSSGIGVNDGKIVASYSGANGTVSAFNITAPSTIAPTSTSGSSATFGALGANSYTVSVTDAVCTEKASIALAAFVSCSSCPSGSTAQGNQCVILSQASCPAGFTLSAGNCTMACSTAPAPGPSPSGTCSLAITTTPHNPTSATNADGSIDVNWSGNAGSVMIQSSGTSGVISNAGTSGAIEKLQAGTYTITISDSANPGCKATTVRSLSFAATPSTYVLKCQAKVCFPGSAVYQTFDCSVNSLGDFKFSDMYSNLKACTPGSTPYPTTDAEKAAVCNNASLCPPKADTTPLCNVLSCGGAGSLRYFKSSTGVEDFAKANSYTNSTGGSACKSNLGYTVLAVCSNATPAQTKCTLTDLSYYLATSSAESCY